MATMRSMPGDICLSSYNHFPAISVLELLKPVKLPGGLDRLATMPPSLAKRTRP